MKVLLSIRPEYAEKILNGTKRFEYRKTLFKRKNVSKIVIYATQPVGKVIGEFEVGGLLSAAPSSLWKQTRDYAGVSKKFYMAYFKGKETAFAIRVQNPVRYHKPITLDKLNGILLAPQSFRYLF